MIQLKKVNSSNQDFQKLVKELDAYLKITDGEDHEFYNQFNGLEKIKHALVVYKNHKPIGCGAFRQFDEATVEIKRMYLQPNERGSGIAAEILQMLENWVKELGYKRTILETGDRQVEAVKFYKKSGYKRISNYGQYAQMENSNCFEKKL